MKNWEAQARTNAVLAGSVRALEARVDDCYQLLEWRHEAEGELAEFKAQLEQMGDELDELRTRSKNASGNKFRAAAKSSRPSAAPASSKIVPQGASLLSPAAAGGVELSLAGGHAGQFGGEVAIPASTGSLDRHSGSGRAFLGLVVLQAVLSLGVVAQLGVVAWTEGHLETVHTGLLGGLALASAGFGVGLGLAGPDKTLYNAFVAVQFCLSGYASHAMYVQISVYDKHVDFCGLEGLTGEMRAKACGDGLMKAKYTLAYCAYVFVAVVAQVLLVLKAKDEILEREFAMKMKKAVTPPVASIFGSAAGALAGTATAAASGYQQGQAIGANFKAPSAQEVAKNMSNLLLGSVGSMKDSFKGALSPMKA